MGFPPWPIGGDKLTHKGMRPTRLRDFGAFGASISDLETHKLAVPPEERQPTDQYKVIPFPPASGQLTLEGESTGFSAGGAEVTKPLPAVSRSTTRKRPRTIKYIQTFLRLTCTLVLFFFLFRSFTWSALVSTLTHIDRPMVLIGLTVGAFGIVVSSYQWRSLLQAEHIRYDLAALINLYMVGMAFSHFLPTGMGGDVIKAIYVGRESGNSAGATSAVLLSRITGFLGMLLLSLAVLLIWHSHFSSGIIIWFLLLALLVSSLIGGALIGATLLPHLTLWRKQRGRRAPGQSQQSNISSMGRRTAKQKLPLAARRLLDKGIEIGLALSQALKRPRTLGVAILFGIEFWVVSGLNYYSYANALGMKVPLYFYFIAIPLVSLITFLPISINGFGVRESVFVSIFSTIHVPIATSLLLVLLMDAQVLFIGAIGGCIYFFMGNKTFAGKQRRVA